MISPKKYYAVPGELSDLSDFKSFTDWLSADPRTIFQVAQGLIVHDAWIERYEVKPQPSQIRDKCTLSASDILSQALRLRKNEISLALPRSPEERVVGCCREFALLAVALFKAKGVPARARCGFALYMAAPGFYEDHWVCEYWNGNDWQAMDPQVDPFQQSTFENYANSEPNIELGYKEVLLSLDPLDVSNQHFLNAGTAWKMYREGHADPGRFGIGADPKQPTMSYPHGAWFMRGQLLRDFAALNKVETVPYLVRLEAGQDWRPWRLVAAKDDELSKSDFALLDTIADLCASPDKHLSAINQLFESNKELHPLL